MSDTPEIIKIDGETFGDLCKALSELGELLQYLAERDAEAYDKLKPILVGVADRMLAILAANDCDLAPVIDKITEAEDLAMSLLSKATTPEEIAAIHRERAAGWKMLDEAMQKGLKDLEARAKKESQH